MDVAGISEVVGVNVAAVGGGASVTVHGSSMGKTGYTGRGREGGTGCEGTEWVSDSAVRCRVGEGAGGTRRAVVTAGGRGGSVTDAWSTDVAGMSVKGGVNVVGVGGASVTVHGWSMGKTGYTGRVREGGTGCEGTEWVCDSSLRCMVSEGRGGSRRAVITGGVGRAGSLTHAWSVDLGSLSGGCSRCNVAVVPPSFVTVFGSGFGFISVSFGARLGFSSVTQTSWFSDSSISCVPSSGLMRTSGFVITSAMLHGSRSVAFSYELQVSSVKSVNYAVNINRVFSMMGSGFGQNQGSMQVRLHFTSCRNTKWSSTSTVNCKISTGAGQSSRTIVTAHNIVASASGVVSFDSLMARSPTAVNLLPAGDQRLTVFGFGFSGPLVSVNTRILQTACSATIWISITSLSLKVFFLNRFPSGLQFENSMMMFANKIR